MRATAAFWMGLSLIVPSAAQGHGITIRLPFVQVQFGKGPAVVSTPFTGPLVAPGAMPMQGPRFLGQPPVVPFQPGGGPVPGPQVIPGPQFPAEPGQPVPPSVERIGPPMGAEPPPVIPLRPPTHKEFGRSFRPAPGTYEVVLLHPRTNQPVPVRFTLPGGQPEKIRVESDELEYDYGDYEVEIRFHRNGRATVEYND